MLATDNTPCVPPAVAAERKIFDDAVTAVVLIVIAPAVIAAEVPIEALDPVAMESLFPAVPKTKSPFVAVIAPKVAVKVVVVVNEPVTAVLPVALPILTAPVPPVPIVVTPAPVTFRCTVPVAVKSVNVPAPGVVPPIAPGAAKRAVKLAGVTATVASVPVTDGALVDVARVPRCDVVACSIAKVIVPAVPVVDIPSAAVPKRSIFPATGTIAP